jgi:hypothetical protein
MRLHGIHFLVSEVTNSPIHFLLRMYRNSEETNLVEQRLLLSVVYWKEMEVYFDEYKLNKNACSHRESPA